MKTMIIGRKIICNSDNYNNNDNCNNSKNEKINSNSNKIAIIANDNYKSENKIKDSNDNHGNNDNSNSNNNNNNNNNKNCKDKTCLKIKIPQANYESKNALNIDSRSRHFILDTKHNIRPKRRHCLGCTSSLLAFLLKRITWVIMFYKS